MAKNKATLKRIQGLVQRFNKQVEIEQTAYDLEGKTEAQIERIEQKAIDKQGEIADTISELEMSKREIKEHCKACSYVAIYFEGMI